jgi:hypothetical protein
MSIARAQALFEVADVVDDFARDYLFEAKRAHDAGTLDAAAWADIRRTHRRIVVAASRIEDLGHDALGATLDAALPKLKAAADDLAKARTALARVSSVVAAATAFASLSAALVALSTAPTAATATGLANAIADFVDAVRS